MRFGVTIEYHRHSRFKNLPKFTDASSISLTVRSKRRQAKTRKSKRLLPLRLGDNVTTIIKPRTAWVQVHTHLAIAPPLIQNFGAPEDVVLISIKTKKGK